MKLNATEKKKDKLVIEIEGETHTLLNLLRVNAWSAGAKQASYMVKHPYLSQPEIIVRASNPKKVLSDAAQLIIDDTEKFNKEFNKAMK